MPVIRKSRTIGLRPSGGGVLLASPIAKMTIMLPRQDCRGFTAHRIAVSANSLTRTSAYIRDRWRTVCCRRREECVGAREEAEPSASGSPSRADAQRAGRGVADRRQPAALKRGNRLVVDAAEKFSMIRPNGALDDCGARHRAEDCQGQRTANSKRVDFGQARRLGPCAKGTLGSMPD